MNIDYFLPLRPSRYYCSFGANISLRSLLASLSLSETGEYALERWFLEVYGQSPYLTVAGRVALFLLLKGIKGLDEERSEVILPAYTCSVVPDAIVRAGLTPKYADISGLEDFSPGKEDIATLISDNTLAIIIQHTYGLLPEERVEIIRLAREQGVYLIEDLAHSTPGDPLYLKALELEPPDAIFLSFENTKRVNTVCGGAAVVFNERLQGECQRVYSDFRDLSKIEMWKIAAAKCFSFLLFGTYLFWAGRSVFRLMEKFRLVYHAPSAFGKDKSSNVWFRSKYPKFLMASLYQQLGALKLQQAQRERIVRRLVAVGLISNKCASQGAGLLMVPLLRKDENASAFLEYESKLGDSSHWFTSPLFGAQESSYETYEYSMDTPRTLDLCKKIVTVTMN